MTATLERPQDLGPRGGAALLTDPVPVPPQRRDRGRVPITIWLAALVGLGAVLRFWNLGASRLNYDESFTAMAGRLPLGSLFNYLRINDSHPPLDYLLHAPLARAGVSEFWFRTPSVLLSLAALGLFAWWMRSRGRAGVIATALMAVSSFQIQHARDARMYAELQFLGVAVAMLAAAWITRPRRWHAPVLGALVFAGLLTHVSMFLLAAGLLALPGLRTDRDAWRWRVAIGLGGLGWALVWGTTFLTQARGGHSSWIPPTSISTLSTALGRLVTFEPALAVVTTVATVAGGVIIRRRDPVLARVWIACFAVPIGLAAVAGLFAPVVLDRTFTLMAWAPFAAVAFVIDALIRRRAALGTFALVAIFAVIVPSTIHTIQAPTGPDAPLRALARLAKPGDIVAVRPASKAPEIAWSLGVRGGSSTQQVAVPGFPKAFGIRVGSAPASGRTWLLDWKGVRNSRVSQASTATPCAPQWSWGKTHIRCIKVARPIA